MVVHGCTVAGMVSYTIRFPDALYQQISQAAYRHRTSNHTQILALLSYALTRTGGLDVDQDNNPVLDDAARELLGHPSGYVLTDITTNISYRYLPGTGWTPLLPETNDRDHHH